MLKALEEKDRELFDWMNAAQADNCSYHLHYFRVRVRLARMGCQRTLLWAQGNELQSNLGFEK